MNLNDFRDLALPIVAITTASLAALGALTQVLFQRTRSADRSFTARVLGSLADAVVYPRVDSVFVSIPSGEQSDELWKAVQRGAERTGISVERSADLPPGARISDELRRRIAGAAAVLVILSGDSPNVYFELGLAQGLGKRIIPFYRSDSSSDKAPVMALVARAFDSPKSLEAGVEATLRQIANYEDPGAP